MASSNVIVRFLDDEGNPTDKLFPLEEPLTTASFDSFAGKAFVFAGQDRNPDQCRLILQVETHPGSWMTIGDAKGLAGALHANKDALICATVEYKEETLPPTVTIPESLMPEAEVVAASLEHLLAMKAKSSTKRSVKRTAKHKTPKQSPGGKKQVLFILAQMQGIFQRPVNLNLVGMFSGYHDKPMSFKKILSELKKAGYVEYYSINGGKSVSLTLAGTAAAGSDSPRLMNNSEAQQAMKKLLPPEAGTLLDLLSDGRAHPLAAVAAAMGYPNDKTFRFVKCIRTMFSLGVLEQRKEKNKFIQLSDTAFPFGRPTDAAVGLVSE